MAWKVWGLIVLLSSAAIVLYSRNTLLSADELKTHLNNKYVVICGASSGIGEETAYKYAAAGANLILSARSEDKLSRVKGACLSRGAASVHVLPQDFSKISEIPDFKKRVDALFPSVDVLLLNHGAIPLGPWLGFPEHQQPQFVARIFNVNVLSFIELTHLFLPQLENNGGQIHVTSSTAGITPYWGAGVYTSTKHALHGFFISLQQDLLAKQSSVTVSVFTLGLIVTKEMDAVLQTNSISKDIPEIAKGDLSECAGIMASAAVTRPNNVDYPVFTTKVLRALLYFNPYFNEMMVKAEGHETYEDAVQTFVEVRKKGDQIGYQIGNKG